MRTYRGPAYSPYTAPEQKSPHGQLEIWLGVILFLLPSTQQPRAAGASPESAFSFANRAAPRSGSPPPPRSIIFLSPIQQPRAAAAPPGAAFSFLQSSSGGSSPRIIILLSPIQQPRAAGDPPESSPSFLQSSSPAQREIPQKQPFSAQEYPPRYINRQE